MLPHCGRCFRFPNNCDDFKKNTLGGQSPPGRPGIGLNKKKYYNLDILPDAFLKVY